MRQAVAGGYDDGRRNRRWGFLSHTEILSSRPAGR
jgi:hypothetical protein